MSSRHTIMYRREFLNSDDHGGTAFLEASVSKSDKSYVSAHFKIADCNRIVDLDFDVWNASDARERLQKLKRMRTAFTAFEKALKAEINSAYDL
jgi:hypothetical protein